MNEKHVFGIVGVVAVLSITLFGYSKWIVTAAEWKTVNTKVRKKKSEVAALAKRDGAPPKTWGVTKQAIEKEVERVTPTMKLVGSLEELSATYAREANEVQKKVDALTALNLRYWFRRFGDGSAVRPADFKAELRSQLANLQQQFRSLLQGDLFLENQVMASYLRDLNEPTYTAENCFPIQKRFWVLKAFLAACVEAGVSSVPGLRFEKNRQPVDERDAQYFEEIPLIATVYVPFSKLPLLVDELMKSQLFFRVDKLEVSKPLLNPSLCTRSGHVPTNASVFWNGQILTHDHLIYSIPNPTDDLRISDDELLPELPCAVDLSLVVLEYKEQKTAEP